MSKPKTKTQKKIDNNIRLALTDACEQFLEGINGFQWLTHEANYDRFPDSLLITCVFDTHANQLQAEQNGDSNKMQNHIQTALLNTDVILKSAQQQIIFDSEQ